MPAVEDWRSSEASPAPAVVAVEAGVLVPVAKKEPRLVENCSTWPFCGTPETSQAAVTA